jgi:hypothetical protein
LEQKIHAIEIRKQSSSGLLITLLVVGLLIAFTYLLADYFKQHRVQESLRYQIGQKTSELAAINIFSPDIQQRLEEAEKDNQEMKMALSGEVVSSTEVIGELLDAAGSCGLYSSNLSTEKWTSRTIGDSLYRLMPVNLELKGTTASLVDLLRKLESNPAFLSLVVEDLTLDDPDKAGAPDTASQVSARLKVMIVTRPETAVEEK